MCSYPPDTKFSGQPYDCLGSFKTFEMAWIVEGVVRQQPPMRLAPKSCHLVAKNSNFSSSKQVDGSHLLALPSHTSPLFGYTTINFSVNSLNLQMRLSIKWGGAQLIPTAFTLSLLFMASRHCWKLSPDGAFSPSTQLKQIQDGILMFSSSSNSTQAWNCQFRCYIKRHGWG